MENYLRYIGSICRTCDQLIKHEFIKNQNKCGWCMCHELFVKYGTAAGSYYNAVPYWLKFTWDNWLLARKHYGKEPMKLYRHPVEIFY